jgi:GTP-binding protein HflX
MKKGAQPTRALRERALVVGHRVNRHDALVHDLSEAFGLVEAAGAQVVGDGLLQWRETPSPATLFGKGKVEEIRLEIEHLQPDLIVVDNDLTPAQARNLEQAWNKRIVDRSELILDIFARRAQTQQARLQVELAQNEYLAPRLRRMWTHLERMEGAVGTRGPGETQLETDKRLIKRRIQDLKLELEAIEARKQREVRTRGDLFTIGLVGYTNAGKSTLLNKLTNSQEFVADMLFATLDTRTRQWRLSDGRTVLLSDTVGFLQRLPHHLVASFHATLEEALHADLLLHVVDGSHPHADQQMAAVEEVLASLGKDLSGAIIVFNKTDALNDPLKLQYLRQGRPQEVVHISARTGAGLEALNAAVQRRLDRRSALVDLYFPLRSGQIEAAVRKLCAPIEDDYDAENSLRRLRVRLTEGALGNLMRSAGRELMVKTIAAASEPRLA